MSDENPSVLERLAIAARYLLVALFAAALANGWLAASGERAAIDRYEPRYVE